MAGLKIDLIWSPHEEDKFASFGGELTLYQVDKRPTDDRHTFAASVLSVYSDVQYVKCASWYQGNDPQRLLAIGQTSGKVVLTSFGHDGSKDVYNLIGKEFVPPHRRQCNALAWSPVDTYLLAEGLDKSRADHPVFIWDVNAKPSMDTTLTADKQRHLVAQEAAGAVIKPLLELGPQSESCYSLCWFRNQPKLLAAGMNKYLRIYDLRDKLSQREQMTSQTKAVHGLCIDPYNADRMASYHENQVVLWDIRNFEKPVMSFVQEKSVIKLEWSPTRKSLLACMFKSSSVIKLFDVQHAFVGNEDLDPVFTERLVHPADENVISSFTWHSTNENELVSITPTGVIHSVKVFERISLCWSASHELTWLCGQQINTVNTAKPLETSRPRERNDISVEMRQRSIQGYGLQTDQIWQNGNRSFVGNNRQLQSLWAWIDMVKSLWEEGKLKSSSNNGPKHVRKLYGVKAVIWGELQGKGPIASEYTMIPWYGKDAKHYSWKPVIYKSDDRSKALLLCGWGFDKDNVKFDTFLHRLQSEGEHERAAAVALFNLKLKRCLDILNTGAKTRKNPRGGVNLGVVAMALSGFTGESRAVGSSKTLWLEMSGTLLPQIENPYIKAMFTFLTTADSDGGKYEAVLAERGMLVEDRIAFACQFLSDSKFSEYIDNLMCELTKEGNLQGIILTGLTVEGLDLIQNYIDRTGDIQTAAVAVVQALPGEIGKDERVINWIESYRRLLDSWQLWHQRAEFDIYRQSREAVSRPTSHIYISCNFCGKSTSSKMYATKPNFHMMSYRGAPAANKSKITSCPSCRKPLPRCSLCLVNMGTAASNSKAKQSKKSIEGTNKLSPLSDWFTWCQSCRHGGHAEHITEWFGSSMECPVSGCECRCFSEDSMSKVATRDHIT